MSNPEVYKKVWVKLPDGSTGVIDHIKPDGTAGVRPVSASHDFLPNQSQHWTPAQRALIPHEIVLSMAELVEIPTPNSTNGNLWHRLLIALKLRSSR